MTPHPQAENPTHGTEARELTEREARRALREEFGLPPDFQDTDMGWEIEPTEEQAIRKTLKG